MALPPQGVPPRISDEQEFNRMMREEYLIPFLDGALEEIKTTGAATVAGELAAVFAFVEYWKAQRDPLFPVDRVREWAAAIDIRQSRAFARDVKRLGGRAPNPYYRPSATGTVDILEQIVHDSVSLIKTIPERYHQVLATRLTIAEREGLGDRDDRRKIIREVGGVSGTILKRITRDQANKLTGALNIYRLKEAGFQHYQWSTSQDERVRPDHRPREGRIYSVHDGTGVPGDLHPGEAIQCRCVAVAYVEPDF